MDNLERLCNAVHDLSKQVLILVSRLNEQEEMITSLQNRLTILERSAFVKPEREYRI